MSRSVKYLAITLATIIQVLPIFSKTCRDFSDLGKYLGSHEVKVWCQASDKGAPKGTKHSCDCDSPLSKKCKENCEMLKGAAQRRGSFVGKLSEESIGNYE